MPRLITLVIGLIAAILCGSVFAAADSQVATQSLDRMPLSFTKNMGQWDSQVLFRANAGSATMWFTKEGVTYQFNRCIPSPPSPLPVGERWLKTGEREAPFDRSDYAHDSIEQLVLTAKFIGANANPEVVGEGQMEYKCNYFIGNEPMKWRTDVPNYEAIILKDLYPGIDLKYSGDGSGQAAYEVIAVPGADMSQIKVAYEGADQTSLDADGRLILKTKWGDMIAAIGSGVKGTGLASPRLVLNSENTPGFVEGDQNTAEGKSGTLQLFYSTYLGGGGDDQGNGIAVDGSGNAYVVGYTRSSTFPNQNPYQTYQGGGFFGYDAFVTKLSSSGNSLVYSTYLGGGDDDVAVGIAVDGTGNAYVTGHTGSSNFPTQNPYQSTYQGSYDDAFVAKLSGSGNSLIYSTYLGGVGPDEGFGIAVDDDGNAYVTGGTWSSNFPTLNPFQATNQGGGWDAFVTQLSSSGNGLIYSTFLGGESVEIGEGIAVDGNGNAYVTGYTFSSNFPTHNPYQAYQGTSDNPDVFVTKLSSSGASLVYSTYLGGGDKDWGWDIAVDGSGNACVTGETESSDYPTENPFQTYQGSKDAFVTKLSSSGNSLIYSTYLGGAAWDYGSAIAVDSGSNAYVTGYTQSSNFPTLNPYQTYQGYGGYVFVTRLSSYGGSLIYSTYLGGGISEGIAVDGSGHAYVTGETGSSDFPTLNPYQTYPGDWENSNAFVTKLSWTPDYLCGDVNTDEQIDLRDAVFLINYIFVSGPAPHLLSIADVNCSGTINIADVVLLINYIFRAGPAPCAGCK